MITSHILVLPRHKFCVFLLYTHFGRVLLGGIISVYYTTKVCIRGPKKKVWALSMDQAKGRQEKKEKRKKEEEACSMQ
jgi:hypothetical protein